MALLGSWRIELEVLDFSFGLVLNYWTFKHKRSVDSRRTRGWAVLCYCARRMRREDAPARRRVRVRAHRLLRGFQELRRGRQSAVCSYAYVLVFSSASALVLMRDKAEAETVLLSRVLMLMLMLSSLAACEPLWITRDACNAYYVMHTRDGKTTILFGPARPGP